MFLASNLSPGEPQSYWPDGQVKRQHRFLSAAPRAIDGYL
jgi:hypothetical protein